MKSLTIVLLMLSLQAVMGFGSWDLEETIKKCSLPKKLEGKFKFSFTSQQVRGTGVGTIHVDYTNGKAFVSEKTIVNKTTHNTGYYTSNNITYYVAPSKKKCRKQDFAILPGTVPAGVKITRGEVQGVRVQIWEFSFSQGRGTERIYLTEDKCMFVKMTVKGQGSSFIQNYYDMKEGIKDTSIFDIPKYCVKRGYYGYIDFLSQVQIQV